MATPKQRMVPKLGSIDELLKLSEQSYKEPEVAEAAKGGILSIPICKIRFFQDHPFRLYEGERLTDMADSIANNGVLVPVIVRQIEMDENGCEYEMLAGHNRMNATLLIGLEQLPSIVKEKLTDEEALMYVVETNVLQRSFSDMLPSEKAKVLGLRYSDMFSQGKRNDIIEELKKLENPQYIKESSTGGQIVHKIKSRDALGEEYGLNGRSVARYLRIEELIPTLKRRVDDGEVVFIAAVELSYLSKEEQEQIEESLADGDSRIDIKKAGLLRDYSGKLSTEQIAKILSGEAVRKSRSKTPAPFKLKHKLFAKYFTSQSKVSEVEEIIDKALEMYFAHQRQQHPLSNDETEENDRVSEL